VRGMAPVGRERWRRLGGRGWARRPSRRTAPRATQSAHLLWAARPLALPVACSILTVGVFAPGMICTCSLRMCWRGRQAAGGVKRADRGGPWRGFAPSAR